MFCKICNSYIEDGTICEKCSALPAENAQNQPQTEGQPLVQQFQSEYQPQVQQSQPEDQQASHQPQPDTTPQQPQFGYSQPPIQSGPEYPPPMQPGPVYSPPPGQPGPAYSPPPGQPGPVYSPPPGQPGPAYPPPPIQPGPVYSPPPMQPSPVYPPPMPPSPVYPPLYVQPGPVYPPPMQPGSAYPAPYMQPGPNYQYQDYSSPEAIENNKTRFTQLLHDFGSSKLFLIGIILFMLGNLASVVFSFELSPYITVYSFLMIILPIIGFWLIYSASKSPRVPERSLTAVKCFKASMIITLIIQCLIVLALIIASIALFLGAFATGVFVSGNTAQIVMNILGVSLLIGAAVAMVFIILYFRSVLRVLNGIRDGLSGKPVFTLPGIKFLTVYTCITIGSTLLSSLSNLSTLFLYNGDSYYNMYSSLNELPDELFYFLRSLMTSGYNLVFLTICGVVASVGTLFFIIVLNRFNKSLRPNP